MWCVVYGYVDGRENVGLCFGCVIVCNVDVWSWDLVLFG